MRSGPWRAPSRCTPTRSTGAATTPATRSTRWRRRSRSRSSATISGRRSEPGSPNSSRRASPMVRRPWRGWEDLAPMQALLARALRDTPDIAFLHPGDLAWWVGWPLQTQEELAAKVTIVEDDGAVVGWHYVDREDVNEWVDPAAPDPEAAWRELDAAIEDRPDLARSVCENDTAGVARLRAAGYQPMAEGMVGFSFDLIDSDLGEHDDRVRPIVLGDDLRPRASITRAAFRVDRPFDRYVEEYQAFTRSPAHPHGWDLVAWA